MSLEDVQNALRDSNEWWSAVFDLAGLAVVIGSTDGEVVALSPSFEKVFGYSHSELRHAGGVVGMTHPDDLQADLDLFGELVAGRRDHYQLEKRYFRKDGSLMWGRLTVLLLRDAKDRPAFVVAMTQDISETKQSQALEEQLRAAQIRKQQALELNDNIVQGLVVAKMALEGGFDHKAKETLTATLEKARSIISDLLRDLDAGDAGSLVRTQAADEATPS